MIQRDGTNTSLWQTAASDYQSSHFASTNDKFDLIIVGGGITGLTTGLLLQEAGRRCLVLEAANIGFGTTGGTTAHLNTLLDTPYTTIEKNFSKETAREVAGATAAAIDLIKSNISKYNIDCGFEMTDAYLYSEDEKEDKELDEIADANRDAGLSFEFTETIPTSMPFIRAIRVHDQAKFNPILYIQGLAKAFESQGGILMQHCRVEHVETGTSVQVKTSKGDFEATDLVYATHTPPGINLLHLRCAPWRSYAIAVRLDDDAYPEGLIYDMKDPYYYYRSQEVNGQQCLIAGGEDHKTGEEEDTDQCFRKLEGHVKKYFNFREVAFKWSSQYFEPTDGLPYIGHLPGGGEHLYVASGYGGNGMTYSAVAAITLKAHLLGEELAWKEIFHPKRIKPVAGFVNFISHNADVVKNFATRLFSGERLEELADLAPGEGRLVKYEKEKIGVYKDDSGKVHAINPVCTHMKCEVKWNSSERSWDCPCHGARYSYEGKVVTGPADRDLEQIDLTELISK